MKLSTCEKHGIVWHPGDEWCDTKSEDMIGPDCPVCSSEKYRMKFNEIIETLEDEQAKIEASGEPCPLCGCVGSHAVAGRLDEDLCCIFMDIEYWDRVKEEW